MRSEKRRSKGRLFNAGAAAIGFAAAVAFGVGAPARAQMAVIDAESIAQASQQLQVMQKELNEAREQTQFMTRMANQLGGGGMGVIGDLAGLGDSGVGGLVDGAGGICYSITNMFQRMEGPNLNLSLPDFRSGCGAFGWADQAFFQPPGNLPPLEGREVLERRREGFYDAALQSSVATGLSHKERVKEETASDVADLHAAAVSVQEGENSSATVKHAITTNTMVQIRMLEEMAAVRELLAELLALQAANGMAERASVWGGSPVRYEESGAPSGPGGGGAGAASNGDGGNGGGWTPPWGDE